MKIFAAIAAALILFLPSVFAGEHPAGPYKGSEEFEKLKTLEGSWEGTAREPGTESKENPVKVTYEVTSGGTALAEKLFAGTDHEMISIYNDEKGEVVMTYYCMLRNQPKLKIVRSDANAIELEMKEEANGVKMTDDHMHSLKITFNGPDEITQEWSGYEGGQGSPEPTVLKLKRV